MLSIRKIALLVFLFLCSISFSQSNDTPPLTSFTRVNLGPHGLELTNELPISKNLVWGNSFGLGMGSHVLKNSVRYTFALEVPVPFLKSELKYFYSREKRANKNRSTLNNSGNYIGLQAKYSFGNSKYYDLNQTLLTELHWGIQRPLGKRFIFDVHIGFGYISDFKFSEGSLSPTFGLRFGYKLF